MEEQTLWVHIEPSRAGKRLLSPLVGRGRVPMQRTEETPEVKSARRTIAQLADIVDRLDTFAVAEVDIVDCDHEVEEAGLLGYELGIYLDQLGDEDRLDPGEMFACVYQLLTQLADSGLYDAELTLIDEDTTVDAMLELLPRIAEEAGYYVGPDSELSDREVADEPEQKEKPLSHVEEQFLKESALTWPCALLQLRRQWKIAAARHHPDRQGSSERFRELKQGYDLLKKRAEARTL